MTGSWRAVDELLAAAVADGEVPGLIAVTGTSADVLHEFTAGVRSTGTGAPMTPDTVLRIASQAKLATSVMALQLIEQGRLGLDDPVGDILPDFDQLLVLDGFDDAGQPMLRTPRSRATVRQLLTHTSGLGYDFWNRKLARYYRVSRQLPLATGLRAAFTAPLVADPGTRFSYSMSMDWLGLVIEAVHGKPLDECLAVQVTGPLGMTDTVMWLDPDRAERQATVHVRADQGGWTPVPADYYAARDRLPEFYAGGHSMYATARDYLRLQQEILRRPGDPGAGLLQPATAAELFADHLGGLDVGIIETADQATSEEVDLRGLKWSLGLLVNADGVESLWPAGSAGWAGGFNSFYWIDRQVGIAAALYTQTLPFYDPSIVRLAISFRDAVYAAL
ncbi:MAG TPA: serine hydrolase domain-containing protein [Streptosporangiaceae bacterium]|nr:serine hydrolase domain-containing protein [Streptosporangiaceae bacterium]